MLNLDLKKKLWCGKKTENHKNYCIIKFSEIDYAVTSLGFQFFLLSQLSVS